MKLRTVVFFIALMLFSMPVTAENGLRTMFLNNQAVICGINIRNFNSKDLNKNGIIDENEERGNFINATERLDEIKALNINTLHLFPITPVGKIKALGTAGSLYAISGFSEINPQLVDKKSNLSAKEQAKLFINECHKRGIKVIVDLPCCGSYDLFLHNPELFLKDEKQLSIVPADWTDVRLLNTGENQKLNADVLNAHKSFVDMICDLGIDGIIADYAAIKPDKFWEELIKYTREKNAEFLYLAEASDSWVEPPSEYASFTSYEKLLEAGFDGYYGSFFNFKDWKTPAELIEHIKFNKKMLSSFPENKSVILSFTTHDEISPILIHGEDFSVMICWLEAALPFNPYVVDGFYTGDDYIYPWENTKAAKSETDDDYYFVHRGKLDIFNFSRRPEGNSAIIKDNFNRAMKFRKTYENMITKGTFIPLKTDNEKIFAYSVSKDNEAVIVIGNLDYENDYRKIKIKLANKKQKFDKMIQGTRINKIKKGQIYSDMKAGEIKVLLMKSF